MSIEYINEKSPCINLGQGYFIRLEFEEIKDEKSLAKAKDELRETNELKQQSLSELKAMIESEPDFIYPLHDLFLLTFLRPTKFYSKSAFERLSKFFKFKQKHKKVCDNLTVESVRVVYEDDLVKYLPLRDLNGRRIMYIHCGKLWKPQRATPIDIFRAIQLSCLAAMAEPMTQVNGVSIILDMDGLSLGQICHFTPSFAAMVLEWIQECIPIRVKAVYIVNNSYIFNMLFAIFKPFISSKLRKRIHFMNKDFNKLTAELGKDRVGKKLGGDLPVDDVDGKVLIELLHLFDKTYEIIGCSGYGASEEGKLKIAEGLDEVLQLLQPIP